MAESVAEQIIAAVKSALTANIVADGGANYWYTPTQVARVDSWQQWEPDWFDNSYTTIILIRPGLESEVERSTGSIFRHLELFLVSATKYFPATNNPYLQTAPIGQTIQERLKRDVEKALRVDSTLGGLSLNVEVTDVNKEMWVEGWAVTEMRAMVTYDTYYTTP